MGVQIFLYMGIIFEYFLIVNYFIEYFRTFFRRNYMSLVEKLRALAKAKNTSFSALEKELGFGNGTIQKWDNSSPSCDKLLKLANFLNTSIDSLLRDEPINEITNTAHEQLINLYDKATSQDQLRVINYLELANSLPLSQNLPYNPQYPDTHSTKSTVMRYIPLRGHVAAAYSANDVVLIVLWIMASMENISYLPMVFCFIMFLANDLYGFYNWRRMRNRQEK